MLLLGFFLGMFVGGVFVMTRQDETKRAEAHRTTKLGITDVR